MQLMTLNALSAGLLVAVTSAGMAQELPRPPDLLRTRFCIGSGNCPVVVQVMKNCGSDAHQIAQEICTIHRAGGESYGTSRIWLNSHFRREAFALSS
jgi:hypothetical protein